MSVLVVLVVWGALAGIIACFLTRKSKVRICIIISLPIAAIAMYCALYSYFAPIKIELPENPQFGINGYGHFMIEDEKTIDAIKQLLEKLELQRQLKLQPEKIPYGNTHFYIYVYDLNQAESPEYVAEYIFFVPTPENSIYIPHTSHASNNKYRILNAESIIDELYELVKGYEAETE